MNKDLFGNEVPPDQPQQQKKKLKGNAAVKNAHALLLQLHGEVAGQRCKTCVHLYGKAFSKVYYKCKQFKDTSGPGTDWRINWQACGKWEEDTCKKCNKMISECTGEHQGCYKYRKPRTQTFKVEQSKPF